jgi:hypothetical protein
MGGPEPFGNFGGPAFGHGLGGFVAVEDWTAVLRWGYESPFASPGATRLFEDGDGGFDLVDGRGERRSGIVCLRKVTTGDLGRRERTTDLADFTDLMGRRALPI